MNYEIANKQIRVSIATKGAELQSIFHLEHQIEYLWNANPIFWSKTSPVLFPIVGGLKNNTYQFMGRDYTLPRHGFARDREFVVTEQSPDKIIFTLESDAATLEVYPFLFRFSILYQVIENHVAVTYHVENMGTGSLYFSVGAHPAFALPLTNVTEFADYYLLFNEKETAGRWPLTQEGLIKKEPIPFLENTDKLPLTKELFYADALVFKQLKSNSLSIVSDKTPHGIQLSYLDFPYMGIWSYKDASFVCIEPWCGIADSEDAGGDITKKEGIQVLEARENFTRSWAVKVF